MIKGMTGFGTASVSIEGGKFLIEAKSINHRYLDVNIYIPNGYGAVEAKIRELCERYVERGRVTISLRRLNSPVAEVSFNRKAIESYLSWSEKIKKNFSLKGELTIADLVKLPGVVETKDAVENLDAFWPALSLGIDRVLKSLLDMRKREGKSLAKDLKSQLKQISLQSNKIQRRKEFLLNAKRKKGSEEEFVVFQKNSDIHEEVIRLQHHISEFISLLLSSGAVGKKMDFVAQEMQRETNTIGSKVPDKIISKAVIAVKSKIEKIREQVQNVE